MVVSSSVVGMPSVKTKQGEPLLGIVVHVLAKPSHTSVCTALAAGQSMGTRASAMVKRVVRRHGLSFFLLERALELSSICDVI